MKGFATAKAAVRAARRRGLLGLTGSGQQCGPVELEDGSWAYWTAHTVFSAELPGCLVLPRKVLDLRKTPFPA